jgi:dTDP-L-rhamnose 4-epimerase
MSLILITGGAGFIGSRVVPMLLACGHSVRVLDCLSPQVHGAVPSPANLAFLTAPNCEFLRGSVCVKEELRSALQGVETVIHLAAETGTAQSMYQVARYNDVNVMGTANLLDQLANDGNRSVKRIVLASSRSVYGEGAYKCTTCSPSKRLFPEARNAVQLAAGEWEHRCMDCGAQLAPVATQETDRTNPASIYASTKLTQEQLVSIACDALQIEHAILRLQNVYGEGQSLNNPYTGILSIFSTRIRRGQVLPIFEDGEETRDFIHVQDVARALTAAATTEVLSHRVFNVGSGIKTTVMEIAGVLTDVMGHSRNIRVTGEYRLGDIRHNFADTTRLASLIGEQPGLTLEEGLQRFAMWVTGQMLPEDGLERANSELRGRKLMG